MLKVTGTVKEYYKLTEIADVISIEKLSSNNASVLALEIKLPLSKSSLEDYEGMLVKFSQELTVTDNYFLGQYGEIAQWIQIEPVFPPNITYAPRPYKLTLAQSSLKVACMNVLNYFNVDGKGGGFPTLRGALNYKEFVRQRAKIVSAIRDLDADIVGLMEIENDGGGPHSVIFDVVDTLNKSYGRAVYRYVPNPKGEAGATGTDEIK